MTWNDPNMTNEPIRKDKNSPSFADYALFRRMLTPVLGAWIFWIGMAFVVLGTIGVIADMGLAAGMGYLFFASLFWRIFCEFMLVVFMINQNISDIRKKTLQ